MGLFDKRSNKLKTEEFDSPVEKINLQSIEREDSISIDFEEVAPIHPPLSSTPSSQEYGIEEAIALMRTLPKISIELVVSVVRQTLESTNVNIPAIIEDAIKKENQIKETLTVLRMAIVDLDEEIIAKKKDVKILEADLTETEVVKERLQLAVKIGQSPAPDGIESL